MTFDANGNELEDGDTVQLIKDLQVKGSSLKLKRGDVIKNIRLTEDPKEIECSMGKSKVVLLTKFIKQR